MPVRRYGIFLAYGPTADLKKEGLGRLLGEFLRAAAAREDVRFVIAFPGWSRKSFHAFCESEGIPADAFEIVSTDAEPLLLRAYLAWRTRKPKRRGQTRLGRFVANLETRAKAQLQRVVRGSVSARTIVPWLLTILAATILTILFSPFILAGLLLWGARRPLKAAARFARGVYRSKRIGRAAERLTTPEKPEGNESLDTRLYRLMEEAEIERMLTKINALPHVKAWYCPTSFWPGFHGISAPRLLCVPDVLPAEFPLGFAQLEPELMKSFDLVESTIRGGANFVTYSNRVKWEALVDRYSMSPGDISVIPHASWDLSTWVRLRGFPDEERATKLHCEHVLQQALGRNESSYVRSLSRGSFRFLFYPSQFRPNKNLLTLLRAYEYLIRQAFIPHKLILTGDPNRAPAVADFIREHGLERDVLCLHGLSTRELAACYALADLAVNPSLSEGGFPFTLSEANSVGTPAVMARIPVTEEVIVDPGLGEMMLFDPYDWRDAAKRIEWALINRESLLQAQHDFCARLRQRTWSDVVGDYIEALDRIAGIPTAGVEAES